MMRPLIILLVIGLLVSCTDGSTPEDRRNQKIILSLLNDVAARLSNRYDLVTAGDAVSAPGWDVRQMGLLFNVYRPMTKQQLRALLVDGCNELLATINRDEDIQPLLTKSPFSIKNVEIMVFVYDENHYSVVHPAIRSASIRNGQLHYRTAIDRAVPDRPYTIPETISEETETYEEALQQIQSDND